MKKIWVFFLGILTGIVLVFLTLFFINMSRSSDITFFDEPGEIITIQTFSGKTQSVKCFEVFQTLDKGVALAVGKGLLSQDLIVLLLNNDGTPYYDNQIVRAPKGKCFRQVGIYKYESEDKTRRTVPVVTLMDGEIEEEEEALDISQNTRNKGLTFFEKPGEVMSDNSYKVTKVLDNGSAIARGKSEHGSSYYGLEVLIWDEGATFYDDQIIKAPKGKCFRQIGIFKDWMKTYPIVSLEQQ